MDILIILENNMGVVHRMSLEAMVAGQKLGKDLNLSLAAVVIGGNNSALVNEVINKNVGEVIILENDLLNDYSSDGFSEALKQLIELETPRYVLMGHTYMVRDFIPKVSARLKIPFINDVVSYRIENGNPVFIKQVFNGKLVADVVPESKDLPLISFQSAAFQVDGIESGTARTRTVNVNLDPSTIKTKSEPPFREKAGGVDLSNAEIIVSVGRGIGKEENLPIAKELAEVLSAEIGSSRPIVDTGWLPPSRQVGSSGQSVAPKLYFALGISGAIQHVVGMKGSKNIVAVNKDPEAPIFEIADYGVVGDIMEIIPKLTEAIKNL